MKIIGESERGFIVSIDENETALLSGYNSRYSSGYTKPKIGDNINISTLLDRIQNVERLNSVLIKIKDDINNANAHIRHGINLFEDVVKIPKKDLKDDEER
jgi:hypothetical protein